MKRLISALLLLGLGQQTPADVELTVIGDAWPRAPRTVGQKFGMNARGVIPTEEIRGEDDGIESEPAGGVVRITNKYRVIGVKIQNRRAAPLDGTLTSADLPSVREDVKILPGDAGRFFFIIHERTDRTKIRFELRNAKGDVVVDGESPIDPKARTGDVTEAQIVAAELADEQKTRAKFDRVPASIEVVDETGKPLKGAALTLVQPKIGMIVDAKTDDRGVWSGRLLAGEWKVYARAVVWPEIAAAGATQIVQNPRLYYMLGTLSGPALRLAPDASASITPAGDRVSIVPAALTEFLRYQVMHEAVGASFILTVEPTQKSQPVLVQSTGGLPFDVLIFTRPPQGSLIYSPKTSLKGELAFDPAKGGLLTLDPAKFEGGAERFDVSVSLPDAPREVFTFSATGPAELAVNASLVRAQMTVALKGEKAGAIRFAPQLVTVQPAKPVDLTPTALKITPYFEPSRGLMVWLAIEDAAGKIVSRLDDIKGDVTASMGAKQLFRCDLKSLTLHQPNIEKVGFADISYRVAIDLGSKTLDYTGKAKPRRVFADGAASVEAPENLEAKARSILPMIRKSLEAGQKLLAMPKFDLKVAFEIRLPPEVGGLGGGGMIQLDLGEIVEYAHETDRPPGAFAHELGHCFGFGHDPYMSMAPCAVDEGLYGTNGYVFLNGRALAKFLDYLDRDADTAEWTPSGGVFAAMRMMYGADAHNRMFDLKKKFAARLDRGGISIAEQMAAYYSSATRENVAWLFRAYGWPVFDYRVRFARAMIENQSLAAREELPKKIDGSWLTSWWVRGPIPMKGGAVDPPTWKIHKWDGRFLQLASEDDFLKDIGYHFYLTVQSETEKVCLLSIASDVQVSFYMNGKRASRVAAAPQFSMPVHDGYTLERGNATIVPIVFKRGDNTLEMVVVKTAGSRGMFIELANDQGRPLKSLGTLLEKGPDDLKDDGAEKVAHKTAPPIFNGSFESNLDSWISGAKDGDGKLVMAVDDKNVHDGKHCLRLASQGTVAGGAIQRLVIEEDARYEFTGWIRTEGLAAKRDKVYVGLFTGEPYGGTIVQTDAIEKDAAGWQRVKFTYSSDRREVYIGCILRGNAGATAWFDGLQFVRVK